MWIETYDWCFWVFRFLDRSTFFLREEKVLKYHNINVADCEQLIQQREPLILDCRDVKNYQAGHLENALHVHDGLKESLIKRGDKQRCLLIYCYHGHASQHLAEFFSDFGFKDVYSLEGGYAAWQTTLSPSV
jgi:thiosulfate sulfurtransferase